MTQSENELVVQIEDGPVFRFRAWEKLEKWIERERVSWDWLWNSGTENIGNIANTSRTAIDTLNNTFHQLRAQGAELRAMEGPIRTAFAQQTHDGLFHSESVLGERILSIKDQLGVDPATFAVAYARLMASLADARQASRLGAAMMLAMPELLPVSALAERLTKERASYRAAAQSLNDTVEASEEKRNAEALAAVQRLRKRNGMWARRGLKRWANEFRDWQENRSAAIESIKTVEASYREAMALQAPVEYWDRKATQHRTAESKARGRLLWFFPLATIFLALVFGAAAWFLLHAGTQNVPQALYFVVSAGLASVAGMAFWVGRLLTRLYLSEHHLRHDAEERAVMTTTYLALTHEKAAEEADRQIVLAALFRSTPDGIVRDDGPGDLSIPALLARFGGGR